MKEFINPYTKTRFLVADDRIEEYKAAGFSPVADSEEPEIVVEESKTEKVEEKPKKASSKKAKK